MSDFVGPAYSVDAVFQNSPTVFPKGVTAPRPVMTTLFIDRYLSFIGMYHQYIKR